MSLSRIPLGQVFRSKSESQDSTSTPPGLNSFTPRDITPPPNRGRKQSSNMSQTVPVLRGTRTPQMLEYERQAEERAREQEAMQTERNGMLQTELKIQKEKERIEQEEYEMRQYYEAEALKHAEELRVHQEEVRRHQDRLRAHERMVVDHEASSEAFAKVIAMPIRVGSKRQVSFYNMGMGVGIGVGMRVRVGIRMEFEIDGIIRMISRLELAS